MAIGNPMYHWCNLELRQFFGYDKPLTVENAEEAWNFCNEKLRTDPNLTVRGIIKKANVAFIGTTDDPVDTLEWHGRIAADKTIDVKVCPSFRPDKAINIIFDLITNIPESIYVSSMDADSRVKLITQRASFKAATVSTTLSIPAGFTGILTAIPDIAAIWRIQAQLVADIAATYGKIALLTREAMVWCLFRHSAAQLLRDVAVWSGACSAIAPPSSSATSPSVPAAASSSKSFPRPPSRRSSRKSGSKYRPRS